MRPEYVIFYIIIINAFSVLTCVWDKFMAKKGGWRVPENTLFMLSIVGGSVGMYVTMKTIRHKTKHKRFMIGIPAIIILQILAILSVYIYLN